MKCNRRWSKQEAATQFRDTALFICAWDHSALNHVEKSRGRPFGN